MEIAALAATAVTSAFSSAVGFLAAPLVGAMGEGAAIAFASGALKTVGVMGLSVAAGRIFQPKVGASGATLDFKADPAAPIRGVMGRMAVGGNEVFKKTWGKTNVYLTMTAALSLGPCLSIDGFTADESAVTFAGGQSEATGFYAGSMWQTRSMGLPGTSALQPPTGVFNGSPALSGWTTNHKLNGMVHSLWTLAVSEDLGKRDEYPNGVPDPKWVGRWMLVWDPRLDSTYPGGSGTCRRDDWSTWVYSADPYLHAIAWCRGHYALRPGGVIDKTRKIAGIGAPDDAIDLAAFVAGANVCDANSWTIASEWSTSDDKWQVLAAMLKAGGGEPLNLGAKISCMVSTPRASIYTYTGSDLVGEATIKALTARRDRKNTIIPRYRSEANGWEYVAAGEVTSSVYRDEDRGERRSLEIEYSYVTDAKQAAELAAYDVANAREGLHGALPSKPHLLGLRAGDAFTVDEPELGLNGQKFVVRRRVVEPQSGVVTLEIRSETDGKHAWALGQVANPPPTPSLTGRDPRYLEPPEPGSWDVEIPLPTVDGEQVPSFEIVGSNDNGWADFIVVEIGPSEDGPWTVTAEVPPTTTRIPVNGVQPGQVYWVRLSYRTVQGVYSEGVVYGPYTAPALVASDSISLGGSPASTIVGGLIDAQALIAVQGAQIHDLTVQVSDAEGEFQQALVLVGQQVDAAEGYATAAEGSATSASAAAGLAQTYLGQTSDARDEAVSASLTASTSAQAAFGTAIAQLPERLSSGEGEEFSSGSSGTGGVTSARTENVAGFGWAYRSPDNAQGAIYTRGDAAYTAGDTWEIEADIEQIGSADVARLVVWRLDASGGVIGSQVTSNVVTPVGRQVLRYTIRDSSGSSLVYAGDPRFRAGVQINRNGTGIGRLYRLRVQNVTQREAAAASAATATVQTSIATAEAAAAQQSALTAAQIGTGAGYHLDPLMADWPSGPLPPNTNQSGATVGVTPSKQPNPAFPGGNSLRLTQTAAGQGQLGFVVFATQRFSKPSDADVWVCEFDITLVSGSFAGASILCRTNYDSNYKGQYVGLYSLFGLGTPGRRYTGQVFIRRAYGIGSGNPLSAFMVFYTTGPLLAGNGSHGSKAIEINLLNFRDATAAEVAANEAIPGLQASVAVNSGALVDIDGRVSAFNEVVLDANGRISGTRSENDGTRASFEVLTDVFSLIDPDGGAGTSYEDGIWRVYDGSGGATFYGAPFGSTHGLVLWNGPSSYTPSTARKSNAWVYISQNTTGGPRFGGSEVGSTFSAYASPGSVLAYRATAGSLTTAPVTIIHQNAKGTVNVSWERLLGGSNGFGTAVADNPTSLTTTFTKGVGGQERTEALFAANVTDSATGERRQITVPVTFTSGSA